MRQGGIRLGSDDEPKSSGCCLRGRASAGPSRSTQCYMDGTSTRPHCSIAQTALPGYDNAKART